MKWFIRLFFKTIRAIIGPILLFVDWVTSPKGMVRPAEQQSQVDRETQNLVLYEFKTCPFCIKTRRALKRLSLNIERRDTQHNPEYRQELLEGGGQIKVPCLRIVDKTGADKWMYESDDIIQYLQERFA
jgi:glutaredoxin